MNMKLLRTKIGLFAALAAMLLLVVACTKDGTQATPTPVTGTTYTIEITHAGFSPNPITIKAGDTVTWVNKDSASHWIATASHPTHTVYPGSGIEKCGTAEQPTIFDSCKGIEPGENFSFTFTSVGEWNYHDHLNVMAPFFGKVIVE